MREAAAWFARMRGPGAEADRQAFEDWLRRGATQRSAYNRAAEIFAMGKVLADGEAAAPERGHPVRRKRLVRLGTAAGLISACALGLLTLSLQQPGIGGREVTPGAVVATRLLTTSPGETRVVRLADGSRVRLHGDTVVEVRLGISERRLDLKRGKARFEVFHEPRPFVVQAGGGRVTARGTLFDVALSSDKQVTVHLINGLVDVDLPRPIRPDSHDKTVRRLRAGESISFQVRPLPKREAAKAAGRIAPVALAAQTDAAQDYEEITLNDLIAAANRSASRPIRLGDAGTGRLRLSGRFRIDDTEMLAERLSVLFDLSVDRRHPDEIVLRRR